MSKRKKPEAVTAPTEPSEQEEREPLSSEAESITTRTAEPDDVVERAMLGELDPEDGTEDDDDVETTVNLSGDALPGRDDLDEPTVAVGGDSLEEVDHAVVQRKHLRGLLEALVFASDTPIKTREVAKLASAPVKQVTELLGELRQDYAARGFHLDEVAGGWVFRTSPQYAPFIRDLTKQKPVRLTRAQVETLAIIAYRQPITRPEIDDVRGVDSGPVLKLLLERDLVRILGKRDEPGRPLIYGTTTHFLEFFGLKSLKDLPTLREFTDLTDESREKYEEEMGEPPGAAPIPTEEPEERAPRESMKVPIGDDGPAEPTEDEPAAAEPAEAEATAEEGLDELVGDEDEDDEDDDEDDEDDDDDDDDEDDDDDDDDEDDEDDDDEDDDDEDDEDDDDDDDEDDDDEDDDDDDDE